MENSPHTFRETRIVLQSAHIRIANSKLNRDELELTKRVHFSNVDFVLRKFLERLYFISMYRVLGKVSKYTLIYQKALLHKPFC